jgi:predicted Zn-dependent peptidase
MLWRKPELPLVGLTWVFRAGGPIDAPERAGLATLAAQMTEEGAGDLDALKFAGALQSLGATYGADADLESASAHLTVLKRNFEKGAALMADALRRARNQEEDWTASRRCTWRSCGSRMMSRRSWPSGWGCGRSMAMSTRTRGRRTAR